MSKSKIWIAVAVTCFIVLKLAMIAGSASASHGDQMSSHHSKEECKQYEDDSAYAEQFHVCIALSD